MHFKLETIEQNIDESKSLLKEHWQEIAHYKDIPLDPDYDQYIQLEKLGVTRCFVARDNSGAMVGYAVYFVRPNLHYKSSLQAVQDIIFIRKENRGKGGIFILWIDKQLKSEGVQVTYHHVKKAHNFGQMLEKFNYELVDYIYASPAVPSIIF